MRQVASEAEFRAGVEGWIADDPDARDRAELQALLDLAYASTSAGSGAAGSGAAGSGAAGGDSRNCTTGSRGGSSSGRPGCGGW